ncbi:MAG: hypothetical protein AAF497_23250, partial [Planctomycetota bacterium]
MRRPVAADWFLHRLANEPAQRLTDLRPSVPSELCELVDRMLHRQPTDRIGLDSFLNDIKPFVGESNLSDLSVSSLAMAESVAKEDLEQSPSRPQATLTKFWAPAVAPDPSAEKLQNVEPSARSKTNGTNWGTIVATIMSLAGVVFLGILMKLTTAEGEILIETELPSVKVELVDARDRVKDVKVEQGEKTTTVRTGQYRIRLDSPAEDLEVTPNEVTVTRDKIFRVVVSKRKPAAEAATAAQTIGTPPPGEQRNPAAALQATLQLQDTIAQLARERNRPQADSQ